MIYIISMYNTLHVCSYWSNMKASYDIFEPKEKTNVAQGRGQYLCLNVTSYMKFQSITVLLIYPSLQMQVLFQVVATHSSRKLVAFWVRSDEH